MDDECPICKGRRVSQDNKLAAAQSTDTSEDTLGKLAMDDDPDVRAAAVANPNTPQWAKNRASKGQSQSIDTVDAPPKVTAYEKRKTERAQQKLNDSTLMSAQYLEKIHYWVRFMGVVVAVQVGFALLAALIILFSGD